MKKLLQTGLQQLNLEPNDALIAAYLSYIELLIKWNKAYNLTAITQAEEIVSRHILDSLSVIHNIKGDNCLDVGTGAGLPGLILALAQPDKL